MMQKLIVLLLAVLLFTGLGQYFGSTAIAQDKKGEVPPPVAAALRVRKIVINRQKALNNVLCLGGIAGIGNRFEICIEEPSSTKEGCASEAADFIVTNLCATYCSDSCERLE